MLNLLLYKPQRQARLSQLPFGFIGRKFSGKKPTNYDNDYTTTLVQAQETEQKLHIVSECLTDV